MIKLNHIYKTKDDYYIVIIRNSKAKCYEMHCSIWQSNLHDIKCLLRKYKPYFVFDFLHDVRQCARKLINGEYFN